MVSEIIKQKQENSLHFLPHADFSEIIVIPARKLWNPYLKRKQDCFLPRPFGSSPRMIPFISCS